MIPLLPDAIDTCKYLFLREIGEPHDNGLRVVIEEAKAEGPPEDIEIAGHVIHGTVAVESDFSCRVFELYWPSYVAYGVRNESFTTLDEYEVFEGRSFRVYSKSRFRDYVSRGSFASDEYPGRLRHWGLVCENHIVDVVGCEEPQISALKR